MTPLSLFYDCRVRLDDFGGNTGAAPAGYTYYFESDMTLGQWKNKDLVDALNYALKEIFSPSVITSASPTWSVRKTLTL